MLLEIKLALGGVRRNLNDYSVYFATFAFCSCLLYTYASCRDYLLALGTGSVSLEVFTQAADVVAPLGVFSVVVFCFLARYANRFLVRRRKAELAMMELVGMGRGSVASVLLMECALVAAGALVVGISLGVALSPAFAALASWAFGLAWRPVVVASAEGAWFATMSFLAVSVASALGSLAELRRTSLLDLMQARRVSDAAHVRPKAMVVLELLAGLALLGSAYGICWWSAQMFMAFMIPVAILACLGTYLLLRAGASIVSSAVRRARGVYLKGLTCFVVRQLEAHVAGSCAALTSASALLAVGVCALGLAVGIRAVPRGDSALVSDADFQAMVGTLVYIVLFFGVAFVVSAVAVLALQQMSEVSKSRGTFCELRRLGAEDRELSWALLAQVCVYFLVPSAMATVHDLSGFVAADGILEILGVPGGNVNYGVVLATVLAAFAAYLVVTYRACRRSVLPRRPRSS